MGRRPVGTRNTKARQGVVDDASLRGDGVGESSEAGRTSSLFKLTNEVSGSHNLHNNSVGKRGTGASPERPSNFENGGHNPLMGLVHYGTDSEDEGSSTIAVPDAAGPEATGDVTLVSNAARTERSITNAANSTDTPPLPRGWERCVDKTGFVYFWNTETDETTWEAPMAAAPANTVGATQGVEEAPLADIQGASDATSDTASEPDDEEDDEGAILNAAAVAPVHLPSASSSSPAALKVGKADHHTSGNSVSVQAHKKGREDGEGGKTLAATDIKRGTSAEGGKMASGGAASPVAAPAEAAAGGIDDLFAGIEAELLSGSGGNGSDNAGNQHQVTEVDFSALNKVLPEGLEERAQKAHADLQSSLALMARAEKIDAADSVSRVMESKRAGSTLELRAVLRARLSDWQEGALAGAFLVRRIEEMAAEAKAFVPPDSPPDDLVIIDTHQPSEASVAVTDVAEMPAPTDPVADRNAKVVIKTEVALETKTKKEDKAAAVATGGKLQSRELSKADCRTYEKRDEIDAAAEAQALRAAQAAQKLKWADEVSAAATAAVAAAAALSQAKRDEAKARSKIGKVKSDAGVEKRGASTHSGNVSRHAAVNGALETIARKSWKTTGNSDVMMDLLGGGEGDNDEEEEGEVSVSPKTSDSERSATAEAEVEDIGETAAAGNADSVLPSGWAAVWDETHRAFYYHNLVTDETSWVLPVSDPAPPAALPGESSPTKSVTFSPAAADEPDDTSLAILRAEDEKGMDAGIAKLGKSKTRRTQKEDAGGEDGRGAKINTALHNTPAAEMTDATAGRGEIPVSEMDASTALATGVVANSVETIPSPWVPVWDDVQSAVYYHNTETDETSWVIPDVAASTPDAKRGAASSSETSGSNTQNAKTSNGGANIGGVSSPSGEKVEAAYVAVAPASLSAVPSAGLQPVSSTLAANSSIIEPTAAQGIGVPAPLPGALVAAPILTAEDLRPMTLVWWSDAGDVWDGFSLSGLLGGYGPRRFRNLGGGYYLTTFELGTEWAASAATNLGHGVADPAAAARVDWVPCTASAPGYGLFLRWAGDDDEQKLFDVPSEYFDDPPPDPAIVAAKEAQVAALAASEAAAAAAAAEAAEAAELAEMEREAAAAVAATEQAEVAGTYVANAAITAAATESAAAARGKRSSSPEVVSAGPVLTTPASTTMGTSSSSSASTSSKKRKGGSSKSGAAATGAALSASGSAIKKKRKNTSSLIDKWKAVASSAGEEAEKEAEKQEKMERWKARAAAQDPDNPNFMPLGRRKR